VLGATGSPAKQTATLRLAAAVAGISSRGSYEPSTCHEGQNIHETLKESARGMTLPPFACKPV